VRWLARRLVGCYPARWRERYGEELAGVVDTVDPSVSLLADVGRGVAREWWVLARRSLSGGEPMQLPGARHPGALALVAAVIMAPTAVFVTLSILAYGFGIDRLRVAVDPAIAWIGTVRVIDLALVGAPGFAFLIALMPLLELGARSNAEGPLITIGVRLRVANLLVALVALGLGGLLVAHILAESVLGGGA
jgi:hypothetical protein